MTTDTKREQYNANRRAKRAILKDNLASFASWSERMRQQIAESGHEHTESALAHLAGMLRDIEQYIRDGNAPACTQAYIDSVKRFVNDIETGFYIRPSDSAGGWYTT